MKYLAFIFLFIFSVISLLSKDISLNNKQLDIITGFDVYGNTVKTILNYYIEEIPVDTLIKTGIEGMLANLDPYSEHFLKTVNNETNVIINGKYFGFGFAFKIIHNKVVLIKIRDNSPAKKAGFRIGDIVASVDSIILDSTIDVDKIFEEISNEIVNFKILREGNKDTINASISKDTIKINSVAYSEVLEGDIGFIKLEQFTINTYSEFIKAFYDLQKQKILKGLIIDLRENGGGIMLEALKICNMFVPQGATLLATKGKAQDREYKAIYNPIDTLLPLVVLIDERSASASEIVAGCLQDLDRATIVGNISFGKGLVQEVFSLSNSHFLKLTTAKYYTPSGRCIQKINYFNNKKEQVNPNDSIQIFHTNKGKEVYEMNGIKPDIIVPDDTVKNELAKMLIKNSIVYNFTTHYINTLLDTNDMLNANILEDSNIYYNFVEYATDYNNAKYIKTISELDLIKTMDTNKKTIQIIDNAIKSILTEYKNILLNDEYIKNTIKIFLNYDYKMRTLSSNNFIKYTLLDDKNIKAALQCLTKK